MAHAAMRLLAAALTVVLLGCTPATTSRGTEPGQIGTWGGAVQLTGGGTGSLSSLFQALQALESGAMDRPVTIVQLGDSHTAGDYFTGRLRERFQQRFGRSGRGMMGPGVPFPYFEPTLVQVTQTDGWSVESSFTNNPTGVFAISGYRVSSDDPDDSMLLVSTEPGGFDYVAIGALRQPGGGTLAIAVDGREIYRFDTDGPTLQAARVDLPVDGGGRSLELRPLGDGPVTVLSWLTQRNGPGVILDSHGVVGASINIIDVWDPGTVQWELESRNPAMVVLAFGTNEAFHNDLTAAEYRADFAARLAYVERAAPGTAILVVGPPDANRLPQACRGSGEPDPADLSCRPLSDSEVSAYDRLFGARAAGDACRWHPPPNLETVRTIQREVALSQGHHFWDWSQVMGGACGTHGWVRAEPSLAFSDHVHLRPAGYQRSADALFDDLMAAYDAFRGAPGVAERPSP